MGSSPTAEGLLTDATLAAMVASARVSTPRKRARARGGCGAADDDDLAARSERHLAELQADRGEFVVQVGVGI